MIKDDYISMREITHEDYKKFVKNCKEVTIENVKLKLGQKKEIKDLQPKNFQLETTTVWSFPERGDWATHHMNSKYRGNWAPQIPRNLILKYAKKGDIVLDQMVGSGTTLIECKLLGVNGIGVDINPEAIMITRDRLDFGLPAQYPKTIQKTYVGDARNLNLINDESIDLIITHPPYASIIAYSNNKIKGDLSALRKINDFIDEMKKIASEAFRVLKSGKHCAILIGDTRRHKHYIPVSFRVMQTFLDVGFILKEDIIKIQWKMKSTREKWRGSKYDFYLIGHEHLFIFRKPEKKEKLNELKESIKWW
ncbi:MAG: DNA methyltransferase [Candidatus Aenigmatarchaeota archaeon]